VKGACRTVRVARPRFRASASLSCAVRARLLVSVGQDSKGGLDMVIVQLQGGLGNQLFQYAAGRALALRTQTELRLDLGQLGDGAYRPYRLGIFDLEARPARRSEVPFEFRQPHRSPFARRIFGRLPQRFLEQIAVGPRVVRENSFAFDESVARATGDVYLVGFWQSPRYFEDAVHVIRSDLELSPQRVDVRASLAAEVSQHGTVSVHVRRGDYVSSPLMSACSAAYYERALELLATRVVVRKVYVFSDDIEWARKELRLAAPTVFVSESDAGSDIADFFLMSQCQHHVIANSSFSWWAAWLGRHLDGHVVSPLRWFNDATVDTRDLRPADWLVV